MLYDDPRELLLKEHEKLITKFARKYSRINTAVSYDDLFVEGNLALLRAKQTYTPEKKCAFSTYATSFIIGYIKHYIRDYSAIIYTPAEKDSLPVYSTDELPEYKEVAAESELCSIISGIDMENLLSCLDSRERNIIYNHYFNEKSQGEIAREVGYKQPHVSRLIKAALNTMKDYLIEKEEGLVKNYSLN